MTVIAGPMDAALPAGVECVPVKSASEMHDAVAERMKTFDAVVHCAAVADYRRRSAPLKNQDSRARSRRTCAEPEYSRDSVA